MSRPLYETRTDLSREARTINLVARLWGVEAMKLPIQYGFDFALARAGVVRAFAEVKVRKYDSAAIDRMGGYLLSLAKFQKGVDLHKATGLRCGLVVELPDGIFTTPLHSFRPGRIVMGGRTDRGDAQDIEPTIRIPMREFRLLLVRPK